MDSAKPTFFIVGAPKSGTTSLYGYLKVHPDIFMSPVKEPFYFCPDITIEDRIDDYSTYLALFQDARHEKQLGESSVWYLYSTQAARLIHDFNPQAKIIIMLRSPVEMMYSLYNHYRYDGLESLPTFSDALAAEPDRKAGRKLPINRKAREILFYREVGSYAEQVKRYIDVFYRQQVHVIIHDDFKKDTKAVYQDTLRFLGVDDSFEPDFRIANEAKQIRNRFLHNLLAAPPPLIQQLVAVAPAARHVSRWLRKTNTYHDRSKSRLPAEYRPMQAEFHPDIERLSALLQRDLSCWLTASTPQLR